MKKLNFGKRGKEESLSSGRERTIRIRAAAGALVMMFILTACDGIFPAETKTTLPTGHTVLIKTAFHKPGREYPYGFDLTTGEYNCSGKYCHHSDLRGGIAKVNDTYVISPSCYECHGKIWKEIDTVIIN